MIDGEQGELFTLDTGETAGTKQDFIILSLQSRPWERIIAGTKNFEYRTRFRNRPTVAFIYVSSPKKALSGIIIFGRPIWGNAGAISKVAATDYPPDKDGVEKYISSHGNNGCAIPIQWFCEIPEISLEELRAKFNFTAPQLYLSLENNFELATRLTEELGKNEMVPREWVQLAKATWGK